MQIKNVFVVTKLTATTETPYEDLDNRFFGSYFSPFFHIDKDIDAIFRANETFARFGFVPLQDHSRTRIDDDLETDEA